MIRLSLAVTLLFFTAVPLRAQSQPPGSNDTPTVAATGEGLVKRTPDRAWVHVTVESRAKSPAVAQKQNAEVMAAVLAKLRGAGLAADAMQTRAYDLQPEYDYVNGRQLLRGYLARNSLELRIDELARVGELLELAVSAGATSVGGVRFDLKDRAGAEREALRMAVQDARQRADAAASGAGMKVERIMRIQEQRITDIPPPRPLMMAGRAAEVAAPPIEPGELEIRATVTLSAAIR